MYPPGSFPRVFLLWLALCLSQSWSPSQDGRLWPELFAPLDGKSFQNRGNVHSTPLPAGTLHQMWPCSCAVSSCWSPVIHPSPWEGKKHRGEWQESLILHPEWAPAGTARPILWFNLGASVSLLKIRHWGPGQYSGKSQEQSLTSSLLSLSTAKKNPKIGTQCWDSRSSTSRNQS